MYSFSRLNLSAGYWDLFWPQFLQGVGLSLIFVPLTAVTMAQIRRENMGNATSLFNLMRNLGGSVGIAAAATLQVRYQQKHQNYLIDHVSRFDPNVTSMVAGLRSMFSGQGAGPVVADRRAWASIYGIVQQQAAMLTFVDIFQLMMIVFLLMVPLIVLLKRPPRGQAAGPMH
jgi:DHA2 family multidrug resistance protein